MRQTLTDSTSGKIGGSLIMLFFLGLGSLFTYVIALEALNSFDARAWPQHSCQIKSSSVVKTKSTENPYRLTVGYQYSLNGQLYKSSAISRSAATYSSRIAAEHAAEAYSPEQTVDCLVNPENPAESYLNVGFPYLLFFIFLPLVFVGIGLLGLVSIWRVDLKSRVTKRNYQNKLPGAQSAKVKLFSAVIITGICLVTAKYGIIAPYQEYQSAKNWVEVTATVEESLVKSHEGDDSTTYSAYIVYAFNFAGNNYLGDRYAFAAGSSSSRVSARKKVAAHPPGSSIEIYVNPADPNQSVVSRDFPKLIYILCALLLALLGALAYLLCTLSKKTRPSGPGSPESHSLPDRAKNHLLRYDGRYELKPEISETSKFLVITLIALVWNGILLAFIAISDEVPGILYIFVAVGLLLIAGVGSQLLKFFAPKATVTLADYQLDFKQSQALTWEIKGHRPIDKLSIKVIGQELATYRRGTDTRTDKRQFYEQALYSGRETQGSVDLIIPLSMHSFLSANNEIRWTIHLEAQVSQSPDLKQEYQIILKPALK